MTIRVLLVVGVLIAGCGDGAPTCAQLADHVAELARKQAGTGAVSLASRDVLIANCEAEKAGNATMRACVMKATTLEAAKGCELAAALKRMEPGQK